MKALLTILLALALALSACTNSDPVPRDGFNASSGGGGTGGGGSDEDVGYDADIAEEDVSPSQCERPPREALDPHTQPCCFTDQDCHDSPSPDAHLMRCYSASCFENGEGLCRIPPQGVNDCWTRYDCEDGEQCVDAFTGTCEEPQVGSEFEGICT